MKAETLLQLRELLGSNKVLIDRETLVSRSHDAWLLDLQRRLHGMDNPLPLCVVRPATEAEVALTLVVAGRNRMAVVPYGAGSGVCGGARPLEGAIVVDLRSMNAIIGLNHSALTVTVQPGVMGDVLEKHLNENGYSMGHFPQSIKLSSVGGWVATRASGQFSSKYGSIEDMLVCLRAVLPDGTIISTANVPRRSAGPSVNELLLGSEGTLAVFTELTFKIHPLPEAQATRAYSFASMCHGLEAARKIMRAGYKPALCRLYDEEDTRRHFKDVAPSACCLLLLLSEGPSRMVQAEMAGLMEICSASGGADQGSEPVEAWRRRRFHVMDLDALARESGVVFDTIEVAANWDRVADLYDAALSRLRAIPGLVTAYAHSSHSYQQGTCLYFTFAIKKPKWLLRQAAQKLTGGRAGIFKQARDLAAVEASYHSAWQAVMSATLASGGTISHHHGIGKVRAPWIDSELGTSQAVLARVKNALDPGGIMNPGTLFKQGS